MKRFRLRCGRFHRTDFEILRRPGHLTMLMRALFFALPLAAALTPGLRLSDIQSAQPHQLRPSRLAKPTPVRLVTRSAPRAEGVMPGPPSSGPSPDDYLLAGSAGGRFNDYAELSSNCDDESSTWGCDYLDRDMADLLSHGAYR